MRKLEITFKLFSFLKGKVGKRKITLEVPDSASLKESLEILVEKTPLSTKDLLKHDRIKRNIIILVNGKSSKDVSHKLSNGDQISIMPSIGGGKETKLTSNDLSRYNRQIIMKEFGKIGQKHLKSTNVSIVGVGGIGSPVAIYLAAAGFGNIRLIDKDYVEFSNLNRQILHWENDIKRAKVKSAKKKLKKINSSIKVEAKHTALTEDNVHKLLETSDLVIDGLDNFETRFLVNKFCVANNIPFIHAAVFGLEGRLTTILPHKTPCLRCFLPQKPKEQKNFPIFGATAGIIATLEVTEAIKTVCNIGTPLKNRLLQFDGKAMNFYEVAIEKDPNCPICGN